MPLTELMKKTTHRQFRAWVAWDQEQWNKPDRTDYYLMQVAQEIYLIRMMLAMRKGVNSTLIKFKIPFTFSGEKPRFTLGQATDFAKAKWVGWISAFTNSQKQRRQKKS